MSKESVRAALDNADRVLSGEKLLVKVQYYSMTTGELSSREYTYYSVDRLAVGDIVNVPVRDTITKGKVSAIDVSEEEVASFKDKVKTIPAGSVLGNLEGDDVVVAEATITDEPMIKLQAELKSGSYHGEYGQPVTITESLLEETTETALALRTGEDVEVRDYFNHAVALQEWAEKRVIASTDDNKAANDDLVIISGIKKAMLGKRKEYLDPILGQAEGIRATYNHLMTPIIEAERVTKEKMLAYSIKQDLIRKAQEEINRKRIEAAQEEMKLNGELSESVNLVEVQPEISKTVRTELGSSGQKDNWKWRVINFALVPDEFKIINLAILTPTAKSYKDQRTIPGIEIYNEPIIATRQR